MLHTLLGIPLEDIDGDCLASGFSRKAVFTDCSGLATAALVLFEEPIEADIANARYSESFFGPLIFNDTQFMRQHYNLP